MAAGSTIGALRFTLGADTAEFEKNLKGAETALKRVAVVGTAIGTVLGQAVISTFNKIGEAVKKAFDDADQIKKFSDKLSMSVDQVAALKVALEQNGSSLEKFSALLSALSTSMLTALTDKTSAAARTFQALGISVTDAEGRLRPAQEVFAQISDRFAGWADGAQKSAIATNLFRDASEATIGILNQGSDALRQQGEEARQLGLVLSSQAVQAMNQLKEAGTGLGQVFSGIGVTIANRLTPYVQPLIDWFANLTSSSSALKIALESVDLMLKSLIATGIAIKGVFEALNSAILTVGQALLLLGQGEFRQAWEAAKAGPENFTAKLREASQAIRDLFNDMNNWNTVVQQVQEQRPPAPIVQSAQDAAAALRAAKDEARFFLDTIVNAPTETFVAKMTAIKNALADGTITMREYGAMTRRIAKENQDHWLNLGSSVATALTSIFGQNKTAAIAAAIINTAVGITRALSTLPPPISWAQAALIAATGAAQIATIKSTNQNGSGNAPSVSGGSSGGGDQAQAAPAQTLMVQGISPGQIFTGEHMRDFAQKLLDFQKDGGVVVLK